MFLARLKEYADERMHTQLPPLYEATPVAWIVSLDTDGQPLSTRPRDNRSDLDSARGRRGQDMPAPVVQRSSGIKPLLLADNGEYTFGRASDPKKLERAEKAHEAYRKLVDRCARATDDPSLVAVQRFYERGGVDQLDLDEDWDLKLKVTFEVISAEGLPVLPITLPAVQGFWLSANGPASDATGQCLVCGEHKPVLDRLQSKIKGIRGGQSSGTSLISANGDAFESYGLKKSQNSPTCRDCGEAFTRAANHLIRDQQSSISIANSTFIFWTREKTQGFDLGGLMRDPDPEQVMRIIDSARSGIRSAPISNDKFYAACLSASRARAVVRDWIDTTVGNVADNLGRWFDLQRISDPRDEDPSGENPRPLSLFRLAVSTVRKADDLPERTSRALFRTAIQGTPLPLEIAFQAVRRNRAEQGVRRERAALIRLVLLSQQQTPRKENNYMVALETEHQSEAYHCGRLLAVLERVQRQALPKVNATIVDRYYGAASSRPAVVFGVLLRGAQPHLSKLDKHVRSALQLSIAEVCERISHFPTTLSLGQQALFSLGYYHQRARDRAQAISRRAAKAGIESKTIPTDSEEDQ